MAERGNVVRHLTVLTAGMVLLTSVLGARAGFAQSATGTPAAAEADAEGFRLVARVLSAEWTALAAVIATPEAGDLTAPGAAASPAPEQLAVDRALVGALRAGGYVIYFRHASTDFSQTDADRQDLADCSTQRNLDEAGSADARAIGTAFRALAIPVGDVLSSEYCRIRETAELAFGRVTPSRDLTSRASTTGEAERAERIEALRGLLSTPPPTGVNTVLVGHLFNLQDATGISIAEGEAAIFLPQGTSS
ncbi:MAG: hypothetical protein QOJ59_3991 [Thermomicrobiales bacterium]|jgi:phosphohistidine phosphatase SixA|nr:hypothetical protein [Thermomicrobiales bacterium]